jgi:hypothetical protein
MKVISIQVLLNCTSSGCSTFLSDWFFYAPLLEMTKKIEKPFYTLVRNCGFCDFFVDE